MASKENLRYKDKVTVITGGSQGIGKGCVEAFVKHGSKVVFCDIEDETLGRDLETEMNTRGPGEAWYIPCDVTKEEEIKNLVDKTVEKYGQIDCLVNNAGRHPDFSTIDGVTADNFRNLLNLNLIGYFLTAKYALPHLRKTEGNIINVASLVGSIGQAGAVTYCATKGGVVAMTKALAIDEAKYNVRVNALSPSSAWTPMFQRYLRLVSDPEACIKNAENNQDRRRALLSDQLMTMAVVTKLTSPKTTVEEKKSRISLRKRLLGRMAKVEELGEAFLFLAAEATFCTGIELNVSGGAELNFGDKFIEWCPGILEEAAMHTE